jgi:TonB-dependent SusC/RagA subfamily outer membrane receptor
MRGFRHPLWALLALGGVTVGAQAQSGAITGRVFDQATGQPLVDARVSVLGTSLVATSRGEGRYQILNVPPGRVTVRASLIGYAAATQTVAVGPGDTATADLALKLTPYSLDEVVVTATGEQTKREVGNVVNTIRADSLVATGPIANMNDLLAAKAPGVEVLQGNLTGAGARVRIRGTSSLSLNNEPLYIIDGVRMTSANNSSSIGIGGTNPSRVNDINPEEIESYEVIKGPSAAALYGTAASTGVIIIQTKRGTPGATRWNVYAEQGLIKDYNTYPTAYRGWMTHPSGVPDSGSLPTNGIECFLTQAVAGTCTQDSVTKYNLFEDPQTSPNATGYRNQYGVQVQGGSDAVRYFVSGEWENEVSQLKMPPFAVDSLLKLRPIAEVPFEQLRPNARRRVSLRANADARLNPQMDLSLSSGFVSSTQRLPQTDNNTTGLLSNALGGLGNRAGGRYGYRAFTPDEMFSETVTQDINRFIGSGTLTWRPTSWMAVRATGGIDYAHRLDTDLCRRNECVNFGTTKRGFKTDNRTNFFSYTGDANATATFQLSVVLSSRTSAGAQYLKDVFDRNGASGQDLPPGTTRVGAGAIQRVSEATDITKTVGGYVEQLFGYKERLFVTGALRVDDNSAFRGELQGGVLPEVERLLRDLGRALLPEVELDQQRAAARRGGRLGGAAGHYRRAALLPAERVQRGQRRHSGSRRHLARQPGLEARARARVRNGRRGRAVRPSAEHRSHLLRQADQGCPDRPHDRTVRGREHHAVREPRCGREPGARSVDHRASGEPRPVRVGRGRERRLQHQFHRRHGHRSVDR